MPSVSPEPGWLRQLRTFHDDAFEGVDWEAEVRRLNVRVGHNPDRPFSLVVPGAPPPLFNGDVEQIQPGEWALVISLNHQLGRHTVNVNPDAVWEYWRNYNRRHWYPKFFLPITRLVWTGLAQPGPEDPSEYAASHILFVELCPYASRSFNLSPDMISQLVRSDPGFQLAARVNRLLIEDAEPAIVLVNGSGACSTFQAEFGDRLNWDYREYNSSTMRPDRKPKRLWHYEGFIRGTADVPVVGFPFLRTPATHNSNAEIRQLSDSIRRLAQPESA